MKMNDVIIIGGGPAGAALGSYLSLAGIDNMIIEKAIHPRPHVGESMVPASTLIFKEIGVLDKIDRAGFVKKYGAAWHPPSGSGVLDIQLGEFAQEGVEQPYTYHVERSQFDLLLLKHAESLGSKIYQGVRVNKVLFEEGYASGVECQIGGQKVKLPARMVIDASGRNTLLGRQLKLIKKDPTFNQFAMYSWFEDVDRGDERRADYVHIYFLPSERAWAWQIPISDTITSIGVVTERAQFKEAKTGVEEFFYRYARSSPDLAHAMRNAKQVDEFKSEGDYSYSMEKFVGNGFMLVGDAARFVDPIFSSGISVALYSAKFAAKQIQQAFERNDFSGEAFQPYEKKLRSAVEIWYEFIQLYYKLQHIFTYFIQNEQHRQGVHRLLQGHVYDRDDVPVLREMKKFVKAVEASETHVLKKHLTSIAID